MNINKYDLVEYHFNFDEIGAENNLYIVDLINSVINKKLIYLFEYKVQKDSLIYEVSNKHCLTKVFGKKCLYTLAPLILTKEHLTLLVENSDFYLGHVAIVLSELNENLVDSLAIYWEKEIIRTGAKLIRMDSDGLSLLFYNCYNI